MTEQLSPAARVRRRFLQGRPKKVTVKHTPLSAISSATDAIMDVLEYIHEQEPTLPPDSARCALVYLTGGPKADLIWITADSSLAALQKLSALPAFRCLGLAFIVQEQVGTAVNVCGWVKPFIWSHDSLSILGGMLERQLDLWGTQQ